MKTKSTKCPDTKKIGVKLNDLKPKKLPKGGVNTRVQERISVMRTSRDYTGNHNEAFLEDVS